MRKTLNIDEKVYLKLLEIKHKFEAREKKPLSFGKLIEKLIEKRK